MPRPIHFDLTSADTARAKAFYQTAFGWTVEKWTGPFEYDMIMTGPPGEPGIDGGLSPSKGGGVDTIPDVGRIVNCKDTEGNSFSLIEEQQPDRHVELGEHSGV